MNHTKSTKPNKKNSKPTRARQVLGAVQGGAASAAKVRAKLRLPAKTVNPVLSKLRRERLISGRGENLRITSKGQTMLKATEGRRVGKRVVAQRRARPTVRRATMRNARPKRAQAKAELLTP